MKFAYADPPYYGMCGKYYEHFHPDGRCWDDIETHHLLVERLVRDYPDGWALSCAEPDLFWLPPLCPPGRVSPLGRSHFALSRRASVLLTPGNP